jgi:hypothetical protein
MICQEWVSCHETSRIRFQIPDGDFSHARTEVCTQRLDLTVGKTGTIVLSNGTGARPFIPHTSMIAVIVGFLLNDNDSTSGTTGFWRRRSNSGSR